MALIQQLASLRLTLAILIWLGLGAVFVSQDWARPTATVALPLACLEVNLVAALASNLAIRRQMALFVFHAALAAVVALAAVGRMVYVKASAELTEGEEFSQLTRVEAGPLHRGNISLVKFVNESVRIEFAPGKRRLRTTNAVRWIDDAGTERPTVLDDLTPLVLHGYRFLPSSNKGFAPVLLWEPPVAAPVLGSVHLPPFPLHEGAQWGEWTLPGVSEPLFVGLEFEESVLPEDKPAVLKPPARHALVIRQGENRYRMRVGDSLSIAGGRATYLGLRFWMGYVVQYDWTVPWILGAALVAVLALGWHFLAKFSRRPWQDGLLGQNVSATTESCQ